MASTLQESRILGALQKAKGIGLVEESFTVGGCPIVLRNLRPEDYTALLDEIKELEDAEYIYAFQIGHLCRSIVEIAGVDLRNIEYVEAADAQGQDVSFERHEWLRKHVISTWGREAISTAYRKFLDVTYKADQASTDGITFVVPDENPEDQVKRLLGELKAVEDDLPKDVFERLLDLNGLVRKTSKEEFAAVEQKLAQSKQAEASPADIMRTRKPMNQEVPEALEPPRRIEPEVVSRRMPDLEASVKSGRAAEIAELEAGALNIPSPEILVAERPEERPVLSSPVARLDPAAMSQILDRPPVAGINPRFRRPPT